VTDVAGGETTLSQAADSGREALNTGRPSEIRLGVMLIVFAHACDLLSTYLRTPDLSLEVSPLYLRLASAGLGGWPALLGMKLVVVAASCGMFAFYVRTRRRFYPASAGLTFHDFLHHVHGQDALRDAQGRWKAPSPRLLVIWMCFTVAIGSAAYAYFLAWHNIWSTHLLQWMADAVAPAVIFMVSAVVFWQTLYGDYRRVVPGP
jgi:hypothetical protein